MIVIPGGAYRGAFAVSGPNGLQNPDGMDADPPTFPEVRMYLNGTPTEAYGEATPAESDQTDGLFTYAVGIPTDWPVGGVVQGRVRYFLGNLANVFFGPAVTLTAP